MSQISRWLLLTTLALAVQTSYGQTGRSSSVLMKALEDVSHSSWNVSTYYGVLTDYADNRDPRGYTHNLGFSVGYQFTPGLSASSSIGIRAETIGGQIEKEEDRSYAETLAFSPNLSLGLNYSGKFPGDRHTYSFGVSGEPLMDKMSRLEGYKAVLGARAGVTLNFFQKRWAMGHSLNTSTLLNSYPYNSSQMPNADYFYGYGLSNSVRVWRSLRASYYWGIRYTRYLDDYLTYSFSDSYTLAYNWERIAAGLSYSNGGYTENGDVSLWFIDQYRRIVSLNVSYDF